MVGLMIVDMFADHLHSLKEKRQAVSSLKERLKHTFNISISETGHLDSWQKAQLSIATVSNSKRIIESMFRQIEEQIDSHFEMRTIRVTIHFY